MLSPAKRTLLSVALDPDVLAAVRRYGPSIDAYAQREYHISGTALLGKLVQGESGGSGNAVSNAGAKAWTQFMPGSRQIAIDKFGVDPWADPDQAVHAAVLHLEGKINGSKGLAGYNPGDPSYTNYILGQKVGDLGGGGASSPPAPGTPTSAGGAAMPASPAPAPQFGPSSDYASGLAALLQPKQEAPSSSPLPPPAVAGLSMPQGFKPIDSQGPAQEAASSQSGLLEALRGAGPTSGSSTTLGAGDGLPVMESVVRQRQQRTVAGAVEAQKAGDTSRGAFEIDGPDPDRLQPHLTSFAEKVASVYGGTLTGKDGSTHSKYTVNGNVSQHYTGNATDIFQIDGKPATGARLIAAGRAALIAAGMPRKQAMKAPGGLYNVGGHQIIFGVNGQQYGGDHTDHLHISAR